MPLTFGTSVNFNDPQSVVKFPWKFFLLIGVGIPMVFVVVGARMLYGDYYRSTAWLDTPGTVTLSEVSSYRSDGTMMYTPDIRYRYSVQSSEYEGAVHISSSSWRSSSDEIVAEYPVGKEVVIKVNPLDPAENYLPIPDFFLPVMFIVIGVVSASVFAGVSIYGMRKRQGYMLQERSTEIPGSSS